MQGDPYQVAISYCDGQVFTHDYQEAARGDLDYADASGGSVRAHRW